MGATTVMASTPMSAVHCPPATCLLSFTSFAGPYRTRTNDVIL